MADVKMWQDRQTRQQFIDQGREKAYQVVEALPQSSGVLAIEVASGDYFLGATLGEANEAARERYLDQWLFFVRLDDPEAAMPLPVW